MLHQFNRKIQNLGTWFKPLIFAGFIILFFIWIRAFLNPLEQFLTKEQITPAFIKSFVFSNDPQTAKYKGRTNIIIFGIAGGNREGSDLTDSIMMLSLDWQRKDIVMVSIPRDIWLDSLKDKINTAYHYGEEKKKGGGLLLAKAMVEEVVGQPVHFAWLIDFSGFQKLVDLIGGLDINVETAFTDALYPVPGKENDLCGADPSFSCRFEELHFDAGVEHMDGVRILKYVRSRHADGEEGTDFARSRRQQQVIMAVKSKVFNKNFIFNNLTNYKTLFQAFDDAIDTDMKLSEEAIFAKFFLKVPDGSIRRVVLDDGDTQKRRKGYLVNPPTDGYSGIWVLVPRTGNFDEIHNYISCVFTDPACTMKPY